MVDDARVEVTLLEALAELRPLELSYRRFRNVVALDRD